jgi:hypothetical protein
MTLLDEVRSTVAQLFFASAEPASLPWGRAPLQFAASQRFGGVLGVDDVEGWIDCSLLQHPFFKMFLDGRQVPVRCIGSPRVVKGQTVTGFIDAAKTREVFGRGGTLMLCNMHEWHPPSRALCRDLTDVVVGASKATAFYSPPGNQGLATHRDDAHVFVVQLAGRKKWSLFDVPSDPALRRAGGATPAGPETVVVLEPGDGLYLPPYLAHHARALVSSSSLHMSIHVRQPRGRDVLDAAVDEVLTTDLLGAELSGDRADRAAQVGHLLESLAARLAELDPDRVVAAIERRITAR